MKRLVVFLGIILLLSSFAAAISVTTGAVDNSTGIIKNQFGATTGENEDNGSPENSLSITARNEERFFCGKSTLGACQTDADCIKGGCSGQVCQSKNEESAVTTCEYRSCYDSTKYNINCVCIKNRCMWNRLTETQINKITKWQNKINVTAKYWDSCPEGCTCTGSTVKCLLANGREMTVYAGKSGNVIIQVKGENMTTNVTLYKSEGKLYGTFKNNETKEIKMFQEQVRERIRERLKRQLENENISLDEKGIYQYQGEKKARLFFIFPVKVRVKAELDSQTGEIVKLKAGKWWAFLAKDDESQQIVGASCGTVTPGENDNCCKIKGFDVWNSETQQCEFSI
jgi:eight-cysteine-cluster-containing protein